MSQAAACQIGPRKRLSGSDTIVLDFETGIDEPLGRASIIESNRRLDIDGLRAVAVAGVVIFHMSDAWLPGGFCGVDVFFVISGYVITMSYLRTASPIAPASFVQFYSRRAKRLMPTAIAVTCFSTLLMGIFIPPWNNGGLEASFTAGMLSLVGCSNHYFATMEKGYFDTGANNLELNLFTHTWSLAVEDQFYLAFPFLMCAVYGSKPYQTDQACPTRHRAPVIFGVLTFCSALTAHILTLHQPRLAFYILPSRFWELASGVLLFILESSYQTFWATLAANRCVNIMLQLASFLLIGLSMAFGPSEVDGFGVPFPWMLPAVGGTVCFIVAGSGTSPRAWLNSCLSTRGFVYIGNLSYAIYLWHWPVLVLLKWTNIGTSTTQRLYFLTIVALLSAGTYHFLERPARSWRPQRDWIVFGVFCLAIGVSGCWLRLLRDPLYGKLYHWQLDHDICSAGQGDVARPTNTKLSSASLCDFACQTLHVPEGASQNSSLPPCFENLAPPLHGYLSEAPWTEPCFMERFHTLGPPTDVFRTCLSPNRGVNDDLPAFFLLGDSHATHLVVGLRRALQGRFSVNFLAAGWGCGYLPRSFYDHTFRNKWNEVGQQFCERYNREATAIVASAVREGDIVAVANAAEHFMCSWVSDPGTYNCPRTRDELFLGYREYLLSLQHVVSARGADFLLFGDGPHFAVPGTACIPTLLAPAAHLKCEIAKDDLDRWVGPLQQELSSFARAQGTWFFSYYELFCNNATCGALVPGTKTVAIFDQGHLATAGSLYLWPFFSAFMDSMLVHNSGSPEDVVTKTNSIYKNKRPLDVQILGPDEGELELCH